MTENSMDSDKPRAIIFNDSSLAFRLYQAEYSDAYDFQVIQVSGTPIQVPVWISDSDNSGSGTSDIKFHLHFLYDDFIANNGELRDIVDRLQSSVKYRNRIFLPYEGMSLHSCRQRCEQLGLIGLAMGRVVVLDQPTGEWAIKQGGIELEVNNNNENYKDKSTGPKAKRKVRKV